MLRLLRRQRGFLRLRTGRLSFYVDLAADWADSAELGTALRLHEKGTGPEHARVAGSLLTILVPMRR